MRRSGAPATGWALVAADRPRRVRHLLAGAASLRVRITVAAVLVVAVAMAAAAVVLVALLRASLIDSSRSNAETQSEAVASLIATGPDAAAVSLADFDDDDDFVQVLAPDGSVVDATKNIAGEPAVIGADSHHDDDLLHVPFEDEQFVVASTTVNTPAGRRTVVVGTSVSAATEATDTLTRLLLFGVPILVVFVGGTTWYLVGRALNPVERIRRGADEITASQLHRRLPEPTRRDEIGRLAQTMNRMLARLDQAQQSQRRFVSDAAHELRSPVASIRQNVEVAKAYPDHLSVTELTDIVLAESTRLETLVAALLDLARLDETPLSGAQRHVDVDDLVFAEAARLRQTTTLRVDTTAVSAGRVEGNESALAQVVRNLADNAVRHTRSTIAFGLREDGDQVVLSVDDDGPGIEVADRERVFERFVRLDQARARDDGGSGLGLAIVHDIVVAHNGIVTASGGSLGGACLLVRLPRVRQDDEPAKRRKRDPGASSSHRT